MTVLTYKSVCSLMLTGGRSAEKIMDEIDSAWEKRKLYKDNRQWIGESKSGVTIRGYVSPRKTAFPEYKSKDR